MQMEQDVTTVSRLDISQEIVRNLPPLEDLLQEDTVNPNLEEGSETIEIIIEIVEDKIIRSEIKFVAIGAVNTGISSSSVPHPDLQEEETGDEPHPTPQAGEVVTLLQEEEGPETGSQGEEAESTTTDPDHQKAAEG